MAFSGPYDVLIEHIVAIANALDGQDEAETVKTGNRLRDALSRIADYFENNSAGGEGGTASALPTVTAADNGKVLKVVDGAWVAGDEDGTASALPAVTADDNGKVLKVVDGAWVAAAETTPGT